jgi:hypothetical protein
VNLPDANAFNARVEQLFVENASLTGQAEIKLLQILAQSGHRVFRDLGRFTADNFRVAGVRDCVVDCIGDVPCDADREPPDEGKSNLQRMVNSLLISRDQETCGLPQRF